MWGRTLKRSFQCGWFRPLRLHHSFSRTWVVDGFGTPNYPPTYPPISSVCSEMNSSTLSSSSHVPRRRRGATPLVPRRCKLPRVFGSPLRLSMSYGKGTCITVCVQTRAVYRAQHALVFPRGGACVFVSTAAKGLEQELYVVALMYITRFSCGSHASGSHGRKPCQVSRRKTFMA